jgi:subtilisin-like proprotein convertase family protein
MLIFLFISLVSSAFVSIPSGSVNVTEVSDKYHLKHVRTVGAYEIFETSARTRSNLPAAFRIDQKRRQFKRTEFGDPLWGAQWHLHGQGRNPSPVDCDCDCELDKIPSSVNGQGVTLAIVDDGIQWRHPDLSGFFRSDLSRNFNSGSPSDVSPSPWDGHGTSAAGVCCAGANNNFCGVGPASKASLVGIRLIAEPSYDFQEAEALSHQSDKIRIYSNSWGPSDDAKDLAGPGRVVQSVFERNEMNVYVWAGGNGRSAQDNGNYDGYANNPYVLTIGAVDSNANPAWYSEPCACLLAVTPSSGVRGITTTDLLGSHGYSSGPCTSDFGGTSSAAPLAAGIIALMLQQRPGLGYRDVMHIIARGATMPASAGIAAKHSHDFGFGLLKLPRLLAFTANYTRVPAQIRQTLPVIAVNLPIPQNQWLTVNVPLTFDLSFVERVVVRVVMRHHRRGQIATRLETKDATSILSEKHGDWHSGEFEWSYTSLHHWGESIKAGDVWHVKVMDDIVDGSTGEFLSVQLKILGY